MEKLHSGARWLFRLRTYAIFFFFLIWFMFGFLSNIVTNKTKLSSLGLFYLFPLILIIVLIGELYANLAYKNWKFELAQNELKIEKGIIWKRYSAIPYERVQNVDIRRGILARMMGFSTLDVQTAGYHYTGNNGGAVSEGHIPAIAVKKAEEIRNFLMMKISKKGI